MGNIYIETDENFRVTKIHRMPFDPNNGMGYTKEELERKGFFVNEIPNPVNQIGRRAIAMYNPDNKTVYYEYVNTPISDKERVEQLENAMNFIMRNTVYGMGMGMYSISTMSLDIEEETPAFELNVHEEGAAKYLAHQIITGKLDLQECLSRFPQFEFVIKQTLRDNGIQV